MLKNRFVRLIYIFLVLFSFTLRVTAPNTNSFTIVFPDPVEPYKKLIHAIGAVETMHDTLSFNPVEQAVGYFQIRPIRLQDYNRRTGNKYRLKDMYDYKISEKIFLYYADQIGPYNFEKIAKNWNGSGPSTAFYWKRVKKYL